MKILIVDENPAVGRQLATVLTNLRHEVVGPARDGADAVRLADAARPHLIFLSLAMAEMDALAALRVLRRVVPRASVIAMSGPGARAFAADALKFGARAVMRKPFHAADVREALRRYSQPAR